MTWMTRISGGTSPYSGSGGAGAGGGVGRLPCVSFLVVVMFSQDRFCQRLVEQINVDFLGLDRAQQCASLSRTMWRESGGPVLRRDRLSHCFT